MADATTPTNPRIEELRGRLKADPKSRHFYPLAEELRKIHQLEEAEQILRDGLQVHSSYLSAWISLGRVLRDRARDHEAVEVLKRALSLDPGNVVAAKLLAQAYLGIGDKVEAIKKFKLVFALMPSDEEVEESIQKLQAEIMQAEAPPEPSIPAVAVEAPIEVPETALPVDVRSEAAPFISDRAPMADAEVSRFDATDPIPFGAEEEPFAATADGPIAGLLSRFEGQGDSLPEEPLNVAAVTEPPAAEASPFEDAAEPFALATEPPAELGDEAAGIPEASGSEGLVEPEAPPPIPATMTMAQLYESQGHEEQAAELYKQILAQHPDHVEAKVALERTESAVSVAQPAGPQRADVIRKLERWRERVAKS